MKIIRYDELTEDFYEYKEIEEIELVWEIISAVRRNGDKAIREYTSKFDDVALENGEKISFVKLKDVIVYCLYTSYML